MFKNICVFSSSSDAVAPEYFEAAREVGAWIARKQMTLVYGGGKIGLMGAVAAAVHRHGGHVVGVIPRYLRKQEVAYEAADELIISKDLRERKAIMEKYKFDPNKFKVVGNGWDNPLPGSTDPSNAEHNKRNRRVEVKVFPLESQ